MRQSLLRRRFERIGLIVGIVLAVLVIASVINLVRQSDQGPLEPTAVPTLEPTIGPTLPATPSTPEITFDPDPPQKPGSLLHLLGYAPDRLADDSLPLSDIAQYANIALWMETQGIEVPDGPDDPVWEAWNQQLSALAIPEVLATRGADPVWIDTYGFGLQQIDQVLAVGSAPDYVIVMRGDFEEDSLLTAWAEGGYQAVRFDGVTYWSLYPGGSVDLSAPASRPGLGNMNNIVLLEDGTLIATARSDRMEQVIRVANDAEPSLAENTEVQALLSSGIEPDALVTAILLKGPVLESPAVAAPSLPMATPVPETPQATMLLAGLHIQPESDNRVTMVVVVMYDSAANATSAQARAQREMASATSSHTGEPYADRVQPLSMRVVSTVENRHLLLMHLTLQNGSDDWLQIIEERDLGYLMWPRVP